MADQNIKDYIYQEPVFSDSFEVIADWVVQDGLGVTEETTNVKYYTTAKKSLLFTPDGTHVTPTMTRTLDTAIDLRNTDCVISFYIPPTTDVTEWTKLELLLATDAFAAFYYRNIFISTITALSIPGWYELKFPAALDNVFPNAVTGDIEDILENCKILRFRMTKGLAATTPVVVFDSIRFVPSPPKATYFLTFDDGRDEDIAVANYLHSKGLKATFFVIPNQVGDSGFMDVAQLTALKAQGHLIANHSWNHEYLTDDALSTSAAIDSIVKATDWLAANGFEKGSKIWAVPGGSDESIPWANDLNYLRPYLDIQRNTTEILNPLGVFDLHNLYTAAFADFATTEEYLEDVWLNNGATMIFGFHSVDAIVTSGGELTAEFKALIDLIASKVTSGQLQVSTMDELVASENGLGLGGYRSRYKGRTT